MILFYFSLQTTHFFIKNKIKLKKITFLFVIFPLLTPIICFLFFLDWPVGPELYCRLEGPRIDPRHVCYAEMSTPLNHECPHPKQIKKMNEHPFEFVPSFIFNQLHKYKVLEFLVIQYMP